MYSKLCVIKVDFAPFQQCNENIYGQPESINFLEIEKNLGTKKTVLHYPTQHNVNGKAKRNVINEKDLEKVVWKPILIEKTNDILRAQLENIQTIIVPDKTTESFIREYLDSSSVKLIIHPDNEMEE